MMREGVGLPRDGKATSVPTPKMVVFYSQTMNLSKLTKAKNEHLPIY
jgi:hypothetical protein